MKFTLFLLFLQICVLHGLKTWIKPHASRLSNLAMLESSNGGKEEDGTRIMSCIDRWDIMYRATIGYCQQYCELPPHKCVISFEGNEELNLGIWVSNQKEKYHGKYYGHHQCPPLNEEQRNLLMAIEEFREWVEEEEPPVSEGSIVVDFFTKVEQLAMEKVD